MFVVVFVALVWLLLWLTPVGVFLVGVAVVSLALVLKSPPAIRSAGLVLQNLPTVPRRVLGGMGVFLALMCGATMWYLPCTWWISAGMVVAVALLVSMGTTELQAYLLKW